MKALRFSAGLASALLLVSAAHAADNKARENWDGCRHLVEQYDRIDKSNVERTMAIRAESLLHKGERLCGRDRYHDGMEAMREAIETLGGKPDI